MIIRKSVYVAPRDEVTMGLYVFLERDEAAKLAAGGTVIIAEGPGLDARQIIITTGAPSPASEHLADSARVPAA